MSESISLRQNNALYQLVAVRAYEIWENEGRPEGHDLVNWCEAEEEILSSLPKVSVSQDEQKPSLPAV